MLLFIAFLLGGIFGFFAGAWKWQKQKELAEEKLALFEKIQKETSATLKEQFKGLSSEALKQSNDAFLQLAKQTLETYTEKAKGEFEKNQQTVNNLIKPVQQSLDKVDKNLAELEKTRVGAYASLYSQIEGLLVSQKELKKETSTLVKALRQPSVRGRWGEIQLKRVVELAGMLDHCDFYEQVSLTTEEGRIRPDLLVRLPGEKNIIVDAKAPLESYLAAMETNDEAERIAHYKSHAKQVRSHVALLSKKSYWDQFRPTPEFVILFLPAETFFSAALEYDPTLIEGGVSERVILATPTTLIALLRAVAYGWSQERLSESAEKISELGKELHKRVSDMTEHFSKLGKALGGAVTAYNKTMGTFETRVLVSARRFEQLTPVTKEQTIEHLLPIEQVPRNEDSNFFN